MRTLVIALTVCIVTPAHSQYRPESTFDQSKINELLNKRDPFRNQPPPRNSANQNEPLSAEEINAMKSALAKNWNASGYKSTVTIRVRLSPDGTLAAPPQTISTSDDPNFAKAAASALKAIQLTQPFRMLKSGSYNAWKYMDIDFDPSQASNNQQQRTAPEPDHPTKMDVRGFRLGMSVEEALSLAKALADHECAPEKPSFPCFSNDGVAFDDQTDIWLQFTANLPVNRIYKIQYHMRSKKSGKEINEIVAQQYGLPIDAPTYARHQWTMGDISRHIFLVGGPGNHTLILEDDDLPKQDVKAVQDAIAKQPPPKF
jgi:hypothetical protein